MNRGGEATSTIAVVTLNPHRSGFHRRIGIFLTQVS